MSHSSDNRLLRSSLLRNHLRIGLAPDRLVLAGRRRGFHRTAATSEMLMLEAGASLADWRPAVEALPSAITLSELHRPELTVVLSNHFVRYALLPWNASLAKHEEWMAFARHRLALVHGSCTGGWAIRVAAAAPRGERVVSAAEQSLVDAVKARTAEAGARLVSVQPNLMATFNALRRDIGTGSCWLAVKETGRLTLALLEKGAWRAIRTRRIDDGWRMPLEEILERESAVLGLAQPYTRSVLYMQEDFAVSGRDARHLADWSLAPEEDFGAERDLAPAAQ